MASLNQENTPKLVRVVSDNVWLQAPKVCCEHQ